MIKQVKLNIDYERYVNADYLSHSHSCLCQLKREQAELYEPWNGLPESYTDDNTKLFQLWWDRDQIDYDDLGRQLGMEVVTVSSVLQPPGCTIPLHKDSFYRLKTEFPDRTERRVRANIHLTAYRMGQLIQWQESGSSFTYVGWEAGDGILWDSTVPHLGANAGMDNKITMQISGFLIE
jgi:hypothetical protein